MHQIAQICIQISKFSGGHAPEAPYNRVNFLLSAIPPLHYRDLKRKVSQHIVVASV